MNTNSTRSQTARQAAQLYKHVLASCIRGDLAKAGAIYRELLACPAGGITTPYLEASEAALFCAGVPGFYNPVRATFAAGPAYLLHS